MQPRHTNTENFHTKRVKGSLREALCQVVFFFSEKTTTRHKTAFVGDNLQGSGRIVHIQGLRPCDRS